ncbi:hypothetical protein [uncultured Hyphomicrobium sp.]|uniref:hypothetical protein n=1 Tax=uncultured Hyphomicrobium sp. TaxID=194373 RepID=UPI0025FF1D7B|nr:hypothetical protein [uncultured Hyphomicrobium sp.]
MTKTTSLLAALALTLGTASAFAQSPAGSPADPTTNENQQPGPSVGNPTDPAAGADPEARVPTSPPGTGSAAEGAGAGEGGLGYQSPAGIPADPNTNENQQMAPSNINPADPDAGSNPSARVPTEPE